MSFNHFSINIKSSYLLKNNKGFRLLLVAMILKIYFFFVFFPVLKFTTQLLNPILDFFSLRDINIFFTDPHCLKTLNKVPHQNGPTIQNILSILQYNQIKLKPLKFEKIQAFLAKNCQKNSIFTH